MPSLTSAMLTALQNYAAACVFDQTCIISRESATPLTLARKTGSFTVIAAAQPCNFKRPSQSLLSAIASRVASLNLWDVTMAISANVQEQDQITVSGKTLIVQSLTSIESFGVLLHVLCSEAS